jgi:hypothetical protein
MPCPIPTATPGICDAPSRARRAEIRVVRYMAALECRAAAVLGGEVEVLRVDIQELPVIESDAQCGAVSVFGHDSLGTSADATPEEAEVVAGADAVSDSELTPVGRWLVIHGVSSNGAASQWWRS